MALELCYSRSWVIRRCSGGDMLPLISENGGISFPAEKVFDPNVALLARWMMLILCVCLGIEGTTTNVGINGRILRRVQLGRTCTQGCCARNNRHSLHPQDLPGSGLIQRPNHGM